MTYFYLIYLAGSHWYTSVLIQQNSRITPTIKHIVFLVLYRKHHYKVRVLNNKLPHHAARILSARPEISVRKLRFPSYFCQGGPPLRGAPPLGGGPKIEARHRVRGCAENSGARNFTRILLHGA